MTIRQRITAVAQNLSLVIWLSNGLKLSLLSLYQRCFDEMTGVGSLMPYDALGEINNVYSVHA